MKQITAILFLSVFLFSKTELYQLFKIPQLITHYQEHKEQNKHLSVWQFLCVHYANGNVKDADYDKDMKLPFKTSDYASQIVSSVFVPFASYSFLIAPVYYKSVKQSIRNNHLLPSLFSSNIWQPPKSC